MCMVLFGFVRICLALFVWVLPKTYLFRNTFHNASHNAFRKPLEKRGVRKATIPLRSGATKPALARLVVDFKYMDDMNEANEMNYMKDI